MVRKEASLWRMLTLAAAVGTPMGAQLVGMLQEPVLAFQLESASAARQAASAASAATDNRAAGMGRRRSGWRRWRGRRGMDLLLSPWGGSMLSSICTNG